MPLGGRLNFHGRWCKDSQCCFRHCSSGTQSGDKIDWASRIFSGRGGHISICRTAWGQTAVDAATLYSLPAVLQECTEPQVVRPRDSEAIVVQSSQGTVLVGLPECESQAEGREVGHRRNNLGSVEPQRDCSTC